MKGAGTHPQVGARDGIWGDWFPLLRAFFLETDAVACDRPGPCVQRGLPLQHQGGGPHFECSHIIWGTCGRWSREGAGQLGNQLDSQMASQPGTELGSQLARFSICQVWKHLLQV